MNGVRLVIADECELTRIGIRAFLEPEETVQVVGEAVTGSEAVELVRRLIPDIILLEVVMPGMDGIQTTRQIREATVDTRIIILSGQGSDSIVRSAFLAGADAYVLKSDMAAALKTALATVGAKRRYLSPQISQKLGDGYLQHVQEQDRPTAEHLTSREHEVASLLSTGKSSKQIGACLGISIRTVQTHRANIMRKVGVHSVTELIHYALAHGILSKELSDSLPNGGPHWNKGRQ